jgi:hypothetical protein
MRQHTAEPVSKARAKLRATESTWNRALADTTFHAALAALAVRVEAKVGRRSSRLVRGTPVDPEADSPAP